MTRETLVARLRGIDIDHARAGNALSRCIDALCEFIDDENVTVAAEKAVALHEEHREMEMED